MPDHANDSLSRFFQKAAQDPQIRFEEGDWKKLEALLNAEQLRTTSDNRFQWKKLAISVVGILLLFVGAYLLISYGSNDIKTTKPDLLVVNSNQAKLQDSVGSRPPNSIKDFKPLNSSQSSAENPDKVSTEYKTNASGQNDLRPSSKEIDQNSVVSGRSSALSLKSFGQNSFEDAIPGIRTQYKKPQGIPPNRHDPKLEMTVSDRGLKYSFDKNITDLSFKTDSIHILSMELETPMPKKAEVAVHADSLPDSYEPTYHYRWSVSLILSPDFSSTGLRRFTSPGEAWGVMVNYRLNNAFSISTGAVKSNKIYRDDGHNYKPNNKGFWEKNTNGVTPNEIQGSCSVLEIPLDLQYNIRRKKNSEVYVAAGLTSYIMLEESYRYTFDEPNPGAAEGWTAKKTTHSLFGMANFSIGYERRISKHIAIGISPYFRVPLTGIGGWANVKLYSMGTAFTIRYNYQKNE